MLTPPIGTPSPSGSSPILRTTSPRRFQTSMSFGNSPAVTRRENGRLIRDTSTYWPSGDIDAPAKMAGLPIGCLVPAGATSSSCDVK